MQIVGRISKVESSGSHNWSSKDVIWHISLKKNLLNQVILDAINDPSNGH